LIKIYILLGFGSFKSSAYELSQKTLGRLGLCGLKKGEVLEVGEKTVADGSITFDMEWELVQNLDDMSVSSQSEYSQPTNGKNFLQRFSQ
jgi:hypothetical protein